MGVLSRMNVWFGALIVLVVLRTQLWFQHMDLEADAAVGKRTTAVFVGRAASTTGILVLLISEVACARMWGCLVAQIWVGYSMFVLIVELIVKSKTATLVLMALGGVAAAVPGFFCLQSI